MALSKQVSKQLAKLQDYKDTFETPAGRKVLADMMAAHGMMSPHPLDPHKMAAREGERTVILRILTMLKTDMNQLKQRMEEHDRSLTT